MKNPNYTIIETIKKKILCWYRKKKFKYCGKSLSFSPCDSVFRYSSITLGDNVFIGKDAIFSCEADIGNNVLFGPRVYITSGRHDYTKIGLPIREQGESGIEKVIIEDDCWVGEGTLILRGVTIGMGSVIGGMSVVCKSIPPFCVCVGNPCKPIKIRYNDKELYKHLKILGYSDGLIEEIINRRQDELKKTNLLIRDDGIIIAIND